jgi:DNA replication and repair protein RecF
MILQELQIEHFRNYNQSTLQFSPEINILLGENAQGKTNALEAIYILAMGKSHRVQKDSELLMWNADKASVCGRILFGNRERTLKIDFMKNGRKALVNGVHQNKMTDFIGHFQVVLFAPEDLQLVKGSPGVRRRFIDMELGQTHPRYLYHLGQYNRIMAQRNAVLKSGNVDRSYLSVFDEQLIEHGTEIMIRRLQFLGKMKSVSAKIYADIANNRELFSFRYHSSISTSELDSESERANIETMFAQSLASKLDSDIRTGYTSTGPHRDDLLFFLDGHPVQSFASQGQQRTIALSLRLAEIDFIYNEIGEYPVLLLDDVLSELDDIRQKNLILSMSKRVQTIITTTSLFHLEEELQVHSKLFHVSSGIIKAEG